MAENEYQDLLREYRQKQEELRKLYIRLKQLRAGAEPFPFAETPEEANRMGVKTYVHDC